MSRSSPHQAFVVYGPAVIVFLLGFLAWASLRDLHENRVVTAHTASVIDAGQLTLSALQDAETGQRGFVLTGRDTYLGPYESARREYARDEATLRNLVSGDPAQLARVDSLHRLTVEKFDELSQTIALRRSRGLDAALAVVETDRGRALMDSARRVLASLDARERARLAEGRPAEARRAEVVTAALVIGTLLAVIMAALLSRLLARRAAAEAEAANEAQRANQAKSEFLTTMSHELRTPLNAIAGYCDILQLELHGRLTPQMVEDVSRIQRSGRFLLSLINDILNFARLESGRIDLRMKAIPAAVALHEAAELVSPQMTLQRLDLQVDVPDDGLQVYADEDRLRQILFNLLTNAVKFTGPGGVVALSARADGDGTVRIVVRDSGRGIAPEEHERIFEPFVQLDRNGVRASQQGVGLGLSISRDLARGMRGDIVIESTLGKGAAFIVKLPEAET